MDDEDGDVVELSGDEEEVSDEDDEEDKDKEMPDFTPEEDDKVWQDDDRSLFVMEGQAAEARRGRRRQLHRQDHRTRSTSS